MTDSEEFFQIVSAYGGKPLVPSAKFRKWLLSHRATEAACDEVARYALQKMIEAGVVHYYSEKDIIAVNSEQSVPVAIRDGLLIVGSCPNGDPIAVDIREQIGAAGYIGHGSMWQEKNVRTVFAVLAPSLGQLAMKIEASEIPRDYYQATQ